MINRFSIQAVAILVLLVLAMGACSRGQKDQAYVESGKRYLANKDYGRAGLQFQNALQVNPNNALAHYYLGLVVAARGDRITAYDEFQKSIDLDPKDNQVQLAMAELLATSNDGGVLLRARDRAKAVVLAWPDSAEALDALALANLKLGQTEDAQRALERAIQHTPNRLKTAVTLAFLTLRKGDRAGAESTLKRVVEQSPESKEAKLVLASFYLLVGKNVEGERLLKTVLDKDPSNDLALLNLANLQFSTGRMREANQNFQKLSASADLKYQPLYGVFLFRSGRTSEAIAEFERLAKSHPSDLSVRSRMIAGYIAVGRTADAHNALDKALVKHPHDSLALLQRSQLKFIAGKYEEAQSDLLQVLRWDANSIPAHFLLAETHAAQGEELSRRKQLSVCLDLNRELLPARIELAQSYIVAGNPGAALDVMEQAPKGQRNLLAYIENRNWALLTLDDRSELRKGIQQGLALNRSRGLLMQSALLRLREQDFSGGRATIEEILKSNPEDLGALHALIRSYAATKQMPLAIEAVRKYAALAPHSARVQYLLGNMLSKAGNRAGARESYLAAQKVDPGFVPASLALASMERTSGNAEQARRSLTSLLSNKEAEIPARMLLSYVELDAHDYEKAIQHLRRVIELQPKNLVALNNLAYLLADNAHQPDEAIKYAQIAKEIAPEDESVSGTLGWAYFQKGIYSSALTELKSAVKYERSRTASGSAVRQYHLAMAYMKTGDRNKAAEVLSAALKLNPRLPEAQIAEQMIGESGQ